MEVSMEIRIPADALAFERRFATEAACRRALLRARFPRGFCCPRCGAKSYFVLRTRRAVQCSSCRKQLSLTAGTLFHGTHLELPRLFRIVYLVVAEKAGTNAMAISRQLGVSYPTALLWMRKVRAVMARRERKKLRGPVEVDETIVGGSDGEARGRRLGRKRVYVVIIAEDREADGMGRIRLRATRSADARTLRGIIEEEVEPGAEIVTDGWDPYRATERDGFRHSPRPVDGSGREAHEHLPLVHLTASLLKRYLRQTFQGSMSLQWIQTMLWEFEYRFNRRGSERRPLLFYRLLETGISVRPPTREEFVALAREKRRAA
jgi:transposase-like protein